MYGVGKKIIFPVFYKHNTQTKSAPPQGPYVMSTVPCGVTFSDGGGFIHTQIYTYVYTYIHTGGGGIFVWWRGVSMF